MRKTTKELEAEIERLEIDKAHWYEQYTNLKEEKRKREQNEMFSLRKENDDLQYQVKNLLEIIRWQINPETARTPFQALFKAGDGNLKLDRI